MECDDNFYLLTKKQQDSLLEIVKNEKIKQCTIQVINDHEKGNNYMGKIVKVNIDGVNIHDERIKKHLIIKIATSAIAMRKTIPVGLMYKLEIAFYETLLPEMKKIQDEYIKDDEKFYFTNFYNAHSEELEEFIIMHNVTVDNFNLEPRNKALDINFLRLAIKNIAYFHSLSFALRKYNPDSFKEASMILDYSEHFVPKVAPYIQFNISQAIASSEDENNKKYLDDLSKDIMSKIATCLNPITTEPYNVLCHGDCWQNNIMFKKEGEEPTQAIFLDWQMGKISSPLVDLLHFLFSASDGELRKKHYHELIDLYYQTLGRQLKKLKLDVEDVYPEHVYKEHIKLAAPYGLVYSIISVNLLVREEEDVNDIELVMKDENKIDLSAMEYKNINAMKTFGARVNDIVNDYREFGLI